MGRFNIWIVLLLASILLNGVLLGAGARDRIAAREPFAAAPHAPEAGRRGFDLRRFYAALPPETRAEARGRLEAARPELRGLAREAAEARRSAMRVLAADDFDPVEAHAALAEARRARADVEAATERVILDSVADLEPGARREALRAAMGGAHEGRRRERAARP